jgi:large subunit ribosomal protein L32
MGAVPKRRISKARKNRRRAHHALKEPEVVLCPKCNQPKRPHFRCEYCGFYGKVEKAKAKTTKSTKKKSSTKDSKTKKTKVKPKK